MTDIFDRLGPGDEDNVPYAPPEPADPLTNGNGNGEWQQLFEFSLPSKYRVCQPTPPTPGPWWLVVRGAANDLRAILLDDREQNVQLADGAGVVSNFYMLIADPHFRVLIDDPVTLRGAGAKMRLDMDAGAMRHLQSGDGRYAERELCLHYYRMRAPLHVEELLSSLAVKMRAPARSSPRGWAIPLMREQESSMRWMLQFERKIKDELTILCSDKLPRIGASMFAADTDTNMVVPLHGAPESRGRCDRVRGGLFANPTGSGKTAVILALVCATQEEPVWTDAESMRTGLPSSTTVRSHATLIVVPSNLPQQWKRECTNFFPTASCILLTNKRQHRQTTYTDLMSADCVITTLSFLAGTYYREVVRSKLGTSPTHDRSVLPRLRDVARSVREDLLCTSPLLQVLWWRRVVYDEAHEIVHPKVSRLWAHAWSVDRLQADVRWLVTGTPMVAEQSHVAFYQKMLLCAQRDVTSQRNENLFGEAYHCNRVSPDLGELRVHEHWVALTPGEQLLLNSYRYRQSADLVVPLCTYYNVLDPQFSQNADASAIRLMTVEEIQLMVQATRLKEVQGHKQALERERHSVQIARELVASLEDRTRDARDTDALTRQLAHARRCAGEQAEALQTRQQTCDTMGREYDFFTRQLTIARNNTTDIGGAGAGAGAGASAEEGESAEEVEACPICLTERPTIITHCGHWYCCGCARRVVETSGKCAMCKRTLRMTDLLEVNTVSSGGGSGGGGSSSSSSSGSPNSNSFMEESEPYGAKMHELIATIRDISVRREKIVLFVQWSQLMRSVKAVLRDAGIQVVSVDGNTATREHALRKMREGEVDVILLSLENGTSGMNLTEANHVMFAHAFVFHSDAVKVATYTQALSRVWRMGQKKAVNVHWFLTRNTLEEQLFDARLYA